MAVRTVANGSITESHATAEPELTTPNYREIQGQQVLRDEAASARPWLRCGSGSRSVEPTGHVYTNARVYIYIHTPCTLICLFVLICIACLFSYSY